MEEEKLCRTLESIMEDVRLGRTSKEEGAKLVKSHIENYHSEEGFCRLDNTQTSYKGKDLYQLVEDKAEVLEKLDETLERIKALKGS
jgi:hypothetical protein